MIKVGLTGNIGSGKSTVARIFEILGVPVYHADVAGKLMFKKEEVKAELIDVFGKEVLVQGEVDRKKLARIVFNDEKALASLNAIIHPRVRADLNQWIDRHSDHKYVIQEAAILFESGFDAFFDKIVFVSCPEEIAIRRVMERDQINEADVRARIKNQWPAEKKLSLSHYVIENDETQFLTPQVLKIHQLLSDS